jgi:hypothetical protein
MLMAYATEGQRKNEWKYGYFAILEFIVYFSEKITILWNKFGTTKLINSYYILKSNTNFLNFLHNFKEC